MDAWEMAGRMRLVTDLDLKDGDDVASHINREITNMHKLNVLPVGIYLGQIEWDSILTAMPRKQAQAFGSRTDDLLNVLSADLDKSLGDACVTFRGVRVYQLNEARHFMMLGVPK